MRFIIVFTLLFLGFQCYSQVVEIPLSHNPQLSNTLTSFESKPNVVKFKHISLREDVLSYCVLSGNTIWATIDTLTFTGAVITIITNPKAGTASLHGDTLYYTANTGITFQRDTVVLHVCKSDSSKCKDITYEFVVERAGNKSTLPSVNVQENTKVHVKIPVGQLPAPLGSITLLNNKFVNPSGVGYIEASDTSFVFASFRGSYNADYLFVACDIYCTCDTFVISTSVHGDTLSLPFMDDFSYPGPYPDPDYWVDDNVFINENFPILPPSVGVASFDGLNKRGQPYGGFPGHSDVLTSRQIDLSSYSINDNVWLSFYIEPKGLLKGPGIQDSFRVEFKDKTGKWNQVHALVFPNFQLSGDSFSFIRVQVVDDIYLYKGFQFRFGNNSDNTGLLDLWHLDYVVFNANVVPDGYFPDVAFTQLPDDLLKTYSAMPIRQFAGFESQELTIEGDKLLLSIDMRNHFNQTVTADPSALRIYDQASGTNIVNGITLLEVPPVAPENQKNIDPGPRHLDAFKVLPSFVNDVKNVTNDKKDHILVTDYTFDQSSEPQDIEAIKRNNHVKQETVLTNYFAYDDGTAESALGVKKTGSGAAVKFHTNVNDTLRAVQFHFPHVVNDITKQVFDLQVWIGNLDGDPIHIDNSLHPFYTEKLKDSLQGFTTYVLMDENLTHAQPVFIPAGDFYVGWIQGTNDELPIAVGLDKNTPEAAVYNFVNVANGWQSLASLGNADFQGAFMVRAVLGDKTPNNTPDIVKAEEDLYAKVRIYPNPANQELTISNKESDFTIQKIEIVNTLGISVYQSGFTNTIDVSNLSEGMYIIKLTDTTGTKQITRKQLIHH